MDTAIEAISSGLDHIFVYRNRDRSPQDSVIASSTSPDRKTSSRTPSAYKAQDPTTDGRSSSTPSSDAGSFNTTATSPLKATAPDFVPSSSPTKPQVDASESAPSPYKSRYKPLFELRASPRGGSGLFAIKDIPIGTRIICERALLAIPHNVLYLAWGPYCRLSNRDKENYDALYFWENTNLGLESASRMYLLDPHDDSIDEEDEQELIAEHIRVMGIFAVNNFLMPGERQGVFFNAARLNHSCIPNVHHGFNSALQKLTVHAMRDIVKDEELVMNYIGNDCHVWTHHQRWDYLRTRYGFTCQCEACSDITGISDHRHELLGALIWGIEQFQKQQPPNGNLVIPESPEKALAQAEDIIAILLDQCLYGVELTRAYRLAASLALDMGNIQRAIEYASNEAEVERNIYGREVGDLKAAGAASALWVRQLYSVAETQGYVPDFNVAKKIHQLTGIESKLVRESYRTKKYNNNKDFWDKKKEVKAAKVKQGKKGKQATESKQATAKEA